MGPLMENNSAESADLIARARTGDREALGALLARHRGRLRRMVEMRLDTRLQARLDASDVVQDAYVEVAERLDEYLRDPKLPLFLWLRLVVGERLLKLHRFHLGTQMRDAGREVSLYRGALPSACLTARPTSSPPATATASGRRCRSTPTATPSWPPTSASSSRPSPRWSRSRKTVRPWTRPRPKVRCRRWNAWATSASSARWAA